MAAPFRTGACLARYLRFHNSVWKSETYKQYVVSSGACRKYANKSQEDFYGIVADQQSRAEDQSMSSAAEVRESETSTADIEALLNRSRRQRKSSMEVTMQTTFGEVRLDKTAKEPYLESVNPEKFWKVIHANTGQFRSEKGEQKKTVSGRQSPKKQAKGDKKSRESTSDTQSAIQWKDFPNPAIDHEKNNYFDEVYFRPIHLPSQTQTVASLNRSLHPEDSDGSTTGQVVTMHSLDQPHNKPTPVDFATTVSHGSEQLSVSFMDVQYFPETFNKIEEPVSHSQSHPGNAQQNQNSERTDSRDELNYIDAQYIGTSSSDKLGHSSSFDQVTGQYTVTENMNTTPKVPSVWQAELDNNVQDATTFARSSQTPSRQTTPVQQPTLPEPKGSIFSGQRILENSRISENEMTQGTPVTRKHGKAIQVTKKTDVTRQSDDTVTELDSRAARQRNDVRGQIKNIKSDDGTCDKKGKYVRKSVTSDRAEEEEGETAYDVAMQIRKNITSRGLTADINREELSPDKQRVKVYKEQVPNLYHMPSAEITKLLAENVIFENEDFIALSKPYGLPSHGGPSVRASVGQLLEPLAHTLDKGRGQFATLHLVHRLDKETTGVMLLAKNAEVAWRLLGMFRRREVKKRYWAITKGVPQPLEGIVEIPLAREKVHGAFKTVVKPEKFVVGGKVNQQKWSRRDDRSAEAITEYRVLSHHDSMALVDLRPLTGMQHQIRAHLAQALNAPILGDHKYSHMDKLAPQRLFPEALQKMGIRQAQVRYLPMHLHAKSLVLPEWRGRNNVFINAAMPKYFLKNLRTLKIEIPKD